MIDYHRNNLETFIQAKTRLINENISCFKYNYSLEDEVQDFQEFPASLKLSKDGSQLLIYVKKPKIQNQYILEADP